MAEETKVGGLGSTIGAIIGVVLVAVTVILFVRLGGGFSTPLQTTHLTNSQRAVAEAAAPAAKTRAAPPESS